MVERTVQPALGSAICFHTIVRRLYMDWFMNRLLLLDYVGFSMLLLTSFFTLFTRPLCD